MKNNKFNLKEELVLIEGTKEWYSVVECFKRLKEECEDYPDSEDFNLRIDNLSGGL